MISIRRFKSEDLYSVVRLVNSSLREYYSPELYLNLYPHWPEGSIVAECYESIVGYLLGILKSPTEARVLIVAVDPLYRSRGIGSSMMNVFIRECYMKDLKSITLEVRVSNTPALKLYTKFGFIIYSIIPAYYRDGEDGYLMYKIL